MSARKLIMFNMLTLDGFFEAPGGDLSWHHTDDEFNRFAAEQTAKAGSLVFGRRTYQMMADFWVTPEAFASDPEVAEIMNRLPKLVFSRTLRSADWKNTRLISDDAPEVMAALKREPGADLYLFGSANLAAGFTRAGLIDEYRLMLNPLVLGGGTPLFQSGRIDLRLADTRAFGNGNLLLTYVPVS